MSDFKYLLFNLSFDEGLNLFSEIKNFVSIIGIQFLSVEFNSQKYLVSIDLLTLLFIL